MHEYHITQSLLQTALDKATLQDGEQIERLHIALDPDSTYLADAIRFYFEQLAQNTAATGAQLEFDTAAAGEQIRLTSIDIGVASPTITDPRSGNSLGAKTHEDSGSVFL